LVSTKGIESSPGKIKTILQMQPPQTWKEVQKLTGHIATLNKFIAKLAERSLPFFSVLRGSSKVKWGLEQQKAFDDLKQYLQHLPTLSSPEQGQPLILYVSATHSVVIGALVVEKEAAWSGAVAK
jgi:phenylalanine-4-hydroxylase